MMRLLRLSGALMILAAGPAGCASLLNAGFRPCSAGPPPRVYGGVRMDVDSILTGHPMDPVFGVLDLLPSLVLDTLLLPCAKEDR